MTSGNPFNAGILLRRLLPIVCIGVIGNLAFSWYMNEQDNPHDWSRFSGKYLLAAAVLSLLPWFWHCVRLRIWSRFFGVEISRLNLLRIVVATDVGGAAMPQAVGGAPMKMALLVQEGHTPGKAATLTLLANFEEMVFFALAIPVSLVLVRPWENPLWQYVGIFFGKNNAVLLLGLVLLAAIFLVFKKTSFFKRIWKRPSSRGQHLAADFRGAVRLICTRGRRPFVLSMLALAAQWTTRFLILVAVLLAMGLPDGLLHIFLLQWMVFVAMVFVPTPGAVGGAEAAFCLVFGRLIPAAALGPALAGWRFLTYYFMLLVGVGVLVFTKKG